MKSAFVFFAGILLLAGQALGAEDTVLKNQRDKASYTIGVYTGNNMKQQSVDIDPDLMAKGIKDSMSGGKILMTDPEMREVMTAFQKEMANTQAERRKNLAEKNKKEGEAFLAENKKKEGVRILPSGVQYKVIQEGTGKSPNAMGEVVVHYRGTQIDGTEFDSSYKRNKPETFKLDQSIQGWKEALMLMKEGAKWQIFIPANLAYGEKGAGPIGPNAALIFDVELISATGAPVVVPSSTPMTPAAKSSKPSTKSSKPAAKK